jgi:myo-inositol-1(or 4)-monophosphatase
MKPNQSDIDPALHFTKKCARDAGAIIIERSKNFSISHKTSSRDLVTQADYESEQFIIENIKNAYPDHRILSEEAADKNTAIRGHTWIIDPLDGTNNFAHGIPQFCVSIAYTHNGETHLGVVYDPLRDEMFTAVKGKGVWCNDSPLSVSPAPSLEQSIIATGFYYDRGEMMIRTVEAVKTLFSKNVQGIRRMGSAALDLCWVACGRYDGFFEYQLSPWDYAAGSLFVLEAGGALSDRDGGGFTLASRSIIASNGTLHTPLVESVRWCGVTKE